MENFAGRCVLVDAVLPDWGKFGSQWYSDGEVHPPVRLELTASSRATVAIYDALSGQVAHEYLETAPGRLMTNMHALAPEGNFIDPNNPGRVTFTSKQILTREDAVADVHLKSCNRCGRFLPVNVPNERIHLSFTNHCVAKQLLPCSHTGFGKLQMEPEMKPMRLQYGFQLECRFCKKFEVNAAHNPQRTAGQMKEDAARRRAFELLLENLFKGTPQLRYRQRTGRELADDVWERFKGRCFKCGAILLTPHDMQLDHTRPLALLWPLDGDATALCVTHNSEKRDRAPVEYYSSDELKGLAKITGIAYRDLRQPGPNMDAVRLLGENLDWFYEDFLTQPSQQRESEGKVPADLLVKALNKALRRCEGGAPFLIDN